MPCSPPGDLPDPGIEPRSSALQEDSLPFEPHRPPSEASECLVLGKDKTFVYIYLFIVVNSIKTFFLRLLRSTVTFIMLH